MTILLPVLPVSFGRWLFWPWVPRYGAPRPSRSLWAWVARWIAQRPRAVWLATAAALMVCAAASSGVRTGLAGDATYTTAPESVVGQRLLAAHFPGGASAPSEVVARASSAPAVLAAVAATQGVAQALPSADVGGLMHVRVVLAEPPDSASAQRTVERVSVHDLPGAAALVGGYTATRLDTANATRHDRNDRRSGAAGAGARPGRRPVHLVAEPDCAGNPSGVRAFPSRPRDVMLVSRGAV
jgi:RND superfamily putative drug exporter